MIWSISGRNVWRNKTRSLVVITAITLGVCSGIFTSAVFMGMSAQRLRKALENEVPYIQIRHPEYNRIQEPGLFVKNSSSVIKAVEKVKGVESAAAHINWQGMAGNAKGSSGVMIYGIAPEKEKTVFGLHRTVTDPGSSYLSEDQSNPILIGRKLANKLKAKVRSKIILTFQDSEGVLVGGAYKVAGIFETKNSSFDEKNVYVLNSSLAHTAQFNPENAHEINIRLKDAALVDSVKKELMTMFPSHEVVTWKEIQPDLSYLNDMMEGILPFTMFVILLALGFGIVNTMLMAVLERIRELGMLMAIGMNKKRIFKMVMFETILLTLTGASLGMLLSGVVLYIFGRTGIDLSGLGGGYSSLGIDSKVYPVISAEDYVGIILLVMITAILSAIYPSLKALKLKPAEVVRANF